MLQVILGIILHGIGALSATFCYMPQKKTTKWSWQTYWLAQATVCWLLLPYLVAWLTVPNLMEVLKEAPTDIMLKSFLFGAIYGIAGNAFGVTIRYIGYSLTYTIAIGMSVVLGTLFPLVYNGELVHKLSQYGGGWIILGMALGICGLILFGISGMNKEKQQNETTSNFKTGLMLCVLTGIFVGFQNLSFEAGQPITDLAAKHGAGFFQNNVIYIFSFNGAFATTLIYTLYLHIKNKTFKEYKNGYVVKGKEWMVYMLMGLFSGVMWYSQFLFYGLGHNHLGKFKFSSWTIHMIMLVLFSAVAGVMLKEWFGVKRKTMQVLTMALLALVVAIGFLTYGNYLGM